MLCPLTRSGQPSGIPQRARSQKEGLASRVMGVTWGPNGRIVFGVWAGGLRHVPDSGGAAEDLTQIDRTTGELSHRLPHFLPGGTHILYTVVKDDSAADGFEIFVASLATGERSLLIQRGSDARYLPTGHLVFIRDGRLFAVRFDLEALAVVGAEVPILEGVSHAMFGANCKRTTGAGKFSVSRSGLLVYAPGSVVEEMQIGLVRFSRDGTEETLQTPLRGYNAVNLSKSGMALSGRL